MVDLSSDEINDSLDDRHLPRPPSGHEGGSDLAVVTEMARSGIVEA